jgi:hypothetical protein
MFYFVNGVGHSLVGVSRHRGARKARFMP